MIVMSARPASVVDEVRIDLLGPGICTSATALSSTRILGAFGNASSSSACSRMTEAAMSLGKEPEKALYGRHIVRFLLPVLSIAGCLLIWEAAVRVLAIPVYMLPAPTQIVGTLVSQSEMLFKQAIATSIAIIAGFVLAVLVGIPLAALMVYSRFFNRAIYPVLLTAQVLPKVALAPLFIVWFGFGVLPKIVMTFLIAFFPIVIDTATGLNLVPA